MELEVTKSISLEDGKHKGKISSVEYRETPYKYTDVFIKEEKTEFELKFGCPTSTSEKSKLMRLLAKFQEIKPGDKVDPEKVLVGKDVTFMTITEEKNGKKYAEIIDDSVKPAIKEEKISD